MISTLTAFVAVVSVLELTILYFQGLVSMVQA